jgi:predicted PurR-regulated permease PerM
MSAANIMAFIQMDLSTQTDEFIRRVFIVVAILAFFVALWLLADVILLVFGAILVAITLSVLSSPLSRLGTKPSIAVVAVALVFIIAIFAIVVIFGSDLQVEIQRFIERFNSASQNVAEQFDIESLGSLIESVNNGSNVSNILSRLLTWSMSLGVAIFSFILMIVGGLYIALDAELYKQGLLKLVPQNFRNNAEATLDDIGNALRAWVLGQFLAMILVGLLTSVGLSLFGIESALALGVLAGIANMVPYLGSIIAAFVTLIVASSQGWVYVGWAAGVMFIVQQIESNIITPMVVGRAVSIQPATGLFAIIAVGVLFGPLGVLLGFPLAVAIDVTVRRLYVRDLLDKNITILGESAHRSDQTTLR